MSIGNHIKSRESWLRGLYILLFGLFYSIAEIVLWFIVLFQFGSQIFAGRPNERLLIFSGGLNSYIYQILQFVTYRSDAMPFPFADWPEGEELEKVLDDEEAEIVDEKNNEGPADT